MESVTDVPEEASGLRQPRFWIRVFLLLDRLPAKANEPCLPGRAVHTHTHTHTLPLITLYAGVDNYRRRLGTWKNDARLQQQHHGDLHRRREIARDLHVSLTKLISRAGSIPMALMTMTAMLCRPTHP